MPTIVTQLPKLPPRKSDSHKGTFGKALIVAGSRGMSGAAVLCGSAALRGGAGLVQVASPADVQLIVASGNPCYTTAGLPVDVQGHLNEDAVSVILGLMESADVLAFGPGLGQSGKMVEIVNLLLPQVNVPIVLDADGINALAKESIDILRRREAPTILTPHPGEFGRLLGTSATEVQSNRESLALQYAADHKVIVVLKGDKTLVTDGDRLYRNTTGNPGMATGGSGDVLTGLIVALVAQKLSPWDAAQLGVWLHGKAGDIAAERFGEVSLTATDLIDGLPDAFRAV